MRTLQRLLLLLAAIVAFAGTPLAAIAQNGAPAGPTADAGQIVWSARLADQDVRAGESTQIIIEGRLLEGWHVFGPQLEGDWINTSANTDIEGNAVSANADPVFPPGIVKLVPGFEEYGVWYDVAFAFAVPVQVAPTASSPATALVSVRTQACDDQSCAGPRRVTLAVDFDVQPGEARPDRVAPVTTLPEQPEGYIVPSPDVSSETLVKEGQLVGAPGAPGAPAQPDDSAAPTDDQFRQEVDQARAAGLLPFLLLSFGAGLLALLTPCVWPMIPITVSYFTKKSEEGKGKTVAYAFAYCLGIIGTFVGLGLAVTLIFGASGVQKLAASPWANAFLGILFVVLALNLFGVFEIYVPQGLVNKAQARSRAGGFVAPILLGFVFSLTTFTCTVPFVGTILVTATTGDILYPVLGMAAFSLAFAIPFFALAIAPEGLKKLPKSGTWLNSVKAYMGFLELAAAAKFFSNIDVVVNDPLWLPFAGFAAVWFTIFMVAALYLFGLVRLPHDDGSQVGVGRTIFAVANVGIAIWVLSGITNPGNLGMALGFFPPGQTAATKGFDWIMTYEEGMARAKAENRPVFINFTGKTCGNCRVMEYQRFPMPMYRNELENFVLIELFTDRETPEDEANAKLREQMTQSATNPAYAILTPSGDVVSVYQGMARTDEEFVQFLKDGYKEAAL